MRVSVTQAIQSLRSGDVVSLPTETVYGLATSLTHPDAIEQIFTLKGRPQDNPLIIHVADRSQLSPYVTTFPPDFERLSEAFWPGSLTLVVSANISAVPERVRAGLETVAFRVPNHPLTLEVLQQTGPLVMPSANLSGKPSATTSEHVEYDFGETFAVLDGGQCKLGLESTILLYRDNQWVIGRQGAISPEQLHLILGYIPEAFTGSSTPLCPGQLYKHYAPQAKLLTSPTPSSDVIVGYSDRTYPSVAKFFSLGHVQNSEEVAHNLYQVLRQLDKEGVKEAWIDLDFPDEGLWITIRERLVKASARSESF